MAAVYQRCERVNENLMNPNLFVTDWKGAVDASWEGYARGYSASRAVIDNRKNDESWAMNTRNSAMGGGRCTCCGGGGSGIGTYRGM